MPKVSDLSHQRHSLAHLLGAAILEVHPAAKLAIGPAIDDGFYYDVALPESISDKDLVKIEKKMRHLLKSWDAFTSREVTAEEAKQLYSDNPYKLELIEEIAAKGEPITLYTAGEFTDLCRGGHAESLQTIDPKSFALDRVAGAYWRGNEENDMLTRIYGLAFASAAELAAYLQQREEAKKRDHRKLGKELQLFTFSELVGPGLPLYTPHGTIIRNQIIEYSRTLNKQLGFGEVQTPNINKAELFRISGHYEKYKEDMLQVRSQYVADEMFLKPMNCPQHTQIYASQPRSYRDLPVRYADFAVLYRDERPGELSGLTRLRAFSQDDGHIFCREDQIGEEISAILDAIMEALATYKMDYWMRLSLRDPAQKEKYLGEEATWDQAEEKLRQLLVTKKIKHKEAPGEAAFYGPKIDIMAVDVLGREWQISTAQLDFVQPARFKLEYTAEDGSKQTPVMIHRALIGSPDRFLAILIEHYAGAFPLWLSPVHVRVLPISDSHHEYARGVAQQLTAADIRAEVDEQSETLGKRLRQGKLAKIPYLLVIGDKEVAGHTVTIESRDRGKEGAVPVDGLLTKLIAEIEHKA